MFRYNTGRDVKQCMFDLGFDPETKDGIYEFSATLGFTDVHLKRLINKGDKELPKKMKWVLYGVYEYITKEEE